MSYENLPDKALSIRQPWVWAILNAGKRLENRPNAYKYRGPICLHASLNKHKGEFEWASREIVASTGGTDHNGCHPPALENLKRGGILATATIVDCIDQDDWTETNHGPWFMGPFALVLEDVEPIEFIPVRGALGLFNWKNNITGAR